MTVSGYTGRIFGYVKTTQLETKEQQKKLDSVAQGGLSAFLKQNNEMKKATTLECITNKIKFGKRLTRDEMEFLKIHNPELYARAVKIEMEREEHRRALKNCKTKEEARNLNIATAFNKKDVELKLALFDEFTEFVKSSEFDELPSERELDDENENENENKNQNKLKFKKNNSIKNAYLHFPQKADASVEGASAPQAETTP